MPKSDVIYPDEGYPDEDTVARAIDLAMTGKSIVGGNMATITSAVDLLGQRGVSGMRPEFAAQFDKFDYVRLLSEVTFSGEPFSSGESKDDEASAAVTARLNADVGPQREEAARKMSTALQAAIAG